MAKATNKGAAAPATGTTATPATVAAAPTQAPALPWVGVQNGVTPPKRPGLCSAVWQLTAATMQAGPKGQPPQFAPLATVKAAGLAQGLNATNVAVEYYRCRQWHGVRGRAAKGPQA